MLLRPAVVRRRPGLLGTVARTAVVAGTATAVSGGIRNRQAAKAQAAADQAATQQAVAEMQQQQAAAAMPAAPQPGVDLTAELKKLADLHTAGALTDEEFATAKARLLG
ncbi:SHOCT domain-containing protein [Hamadaea sp. NPDC051192]|uniref:SHOCT domain-containing protein n=1 Tax=Hamadaea sp. NPDC051192 TaxID=3154940 RepID=UPI003420A90A